MSWIFCYQYCLKLALLTLSVLLLTVFLHKEGGVELLQGWGDGHFRGQEEQVVTLLRDIHHHLTAVAGGGREGEGGERRRRTCLSYGTALLERV